jgi:hypothetical protein
MEIIKTIIQTNKHNTGIHTYKFLDNDIVNALLACNLPVTGYIEPVLQLCHTVVLK